jgi:hypothetical protein
LNAIEFGALARSWRYVWNSQKVCEAYISSHPAKETRYAEAHQKRPVDRFLAQVYYKFLQCHGLIVDADEEVT